MVTMRAMAGAGLQQAAQLLGREAECAVIDRLLDEARAGAGAALVGESVMRAGDPAAAVRALTEATCEPG